MPTHQLLFGFTLWGFIKLYENREDGVPNLAPAGFSILEADIQACLQPHFKQLCESNNLRPVVQCFPLTIDDGKKAFARARELDALLANAHAGTAHLSEDEAVKLVNGLYDEAERAGVKLVLETHRGRLTQDLYRTSNLCEKVPRLRFNLDVSHFVVCEERPGPSEDMKQLLDPILDRVEMIHGRISNGEQIQVDVGDGSGELAQTYRRLWAETMRRWRLRAPAGSSLVFTPELGPPGYAITDAAGREFSDRWQQSLVLRDLAQQAWNLSAAPSSPLW